MNPGKPLRPFENHFLVSRSGVAGQGKTAVSLALCRGKFQYGTVHIGTTLTSRVRVPHPNVVPFATLGWGLCEKPACWGPRLGRATRKGRESRVGQVTRRCRRPRSDRK
jgi:hypothetical protein